MLILRSLLFIAAISVAGLATAAPALAECSYTRLNLESGTRTSISMVVDRNTACTIFANAGSTSLPSGIASFLDTSIVRRPRSGIAGVASKHEWGYKPNPGFVGRDSFVVQMRYVRNTQSQPQTLLIDIDVTVR
jgi:hypothetical protein